MTLDQLNQCLCKAIIMIGHRVPQIELLKNGRNQDGGLRNKGVSLRTKILWLPVHMPTERPSRAEGGSGADLGFAAPPHTVESVVLSI